MYYIYAIANDFLYKLVFDDTYSASENTRLDNRLRVLTEAYIFINSKFRACYFLNTDEIRYRFRNIDKNNYVISETTEPEFEFTEKFRKLKIDNFRKSLIELYKELNQKQNYYQNLIDKVGEFDKELLKNNKWYREQLYPVVKDQISLFLEMQHLRKTILNRKLAIRYFERYFYKESKTYFFYNRHVVTSSSRFSSTILIKNREYIFIDGQYHLFNFKMYSPQDYKTYSLKDNIEFMRYFSLKYDEFDKEIKRIKSDSNAKYCDFISDKFKSIINSIKERLIEYEI
jgi:hypothetical protein|nr:MAG TPA: hypothetical protein [Caudoviricetes sp.]